MSADRRRALPAPLFDLSGCAYFRGIGICSGGCWEEPRCLTEEPWGGWPSQGCRSVRRRQRRRVRAALRRQRWLVRFLAGVR